MCMDNPRGRVGLSLATGYDHHIVISIYLQLELPLRLCSRAVRSCSRLPPASLPFRSLPWWHGEAMME